MNKMGLVEGVAAKCDLSKKDAEKVVAAFFSTVEECLAEGEKVQLMGFGTFEARERQARIVKNPQTGEDIQIEAGWVPAFRSGQALKEAVK